MSVTDCQGVSNDIVADSIGLHLNHPTGAFDGSEVLSTSVPVHYQLVNHVLHPSPSIWNSWNGVDAQRFSGANKEIIDTALTEVGGPTSPPWNEDDEDTDETCSNDEDEGLGEVSECNVGVSKYELDEVSVYKEKYNMAMTGSALGINEYNKKMNDDMMYMASNYQPIVNVAPMSTSSGQIPPTFATSNSYTNQHQLAERSGNSGCSDETTSTFYESVIGSDAGTPYYLPPFSNTGNVDQDDRKLIDVYGRPSTFFGLNGRFFGTHQLPTGEETGYDYQSATVNEISENYLAEPDRKRFKSPAANDGAYDEQCSSVGWIASQAPSYGQATNYGSMNFGMNFGVPQSSVFGGGYSFGDQQPRPWATSTVADSYPWSTEVQYTSYPFRACNENHTQQKSLLQQQLLRPQQHQPIDSIVRNWMLSDDDGTHHAQQVASLTTAAESTATDWNQEKQQLSQLVPRFHYNTPPASTATPYYDYPSASDAQLANYRLNAALYPGMSDSCVSTSGLSFPIGVSPWPSYGNAWGVPPSCDAIRQSLVYGGGTGSYGGEFGCVGYKAEQPNNESIKTGPMVPPSGELAMNEMGMSGMSYHTGSLARICSSTVQNTSAMDLMYDVLYNTCHWMPSASSSSSSSSSATTVSAYDHSTSMKPVEESTARSTSYRSPLQTGNTTSSSASGVSVRSIMRPSSPNSSTTVGTSSVHHVLGTFARNTQQFNQMDANLQQSAVHLRPHPNDCVSAVAESSTNFRSPAVVAPIANVDNASRPWSVVLQELPVRGRRDVGPVSASVTETLPPRISVKVETKILAPASAMVEQVISGATAPGSRASGDPDPYVPMTPVLTTGQPVATVAMLSAQPGTTVLGFPRVHDVKIKLSNMALWKQFHGFVNEMIITKAGRRLFPALQYSVLGLDPTSNYMIFVDMIQIGNSLWKYQSLQWIQTDKEPQEISIKQNRVYGHPDGSKPGSHWMSKPIVFGRLKLTNDKRCSDDTSIQLQSMRRYIPRLSVVQVDCRAPAGVVTRQVYSHVFKETEFIAVTAYQNTDITQLKIDHNPFAKGFRDEANIFDHLRPSGDQS